MDCIDDKASFYPPGPRDPYNPRPPQPSRKHTEIWCRQCVRFIDLEEPRSQASCRAMLFGPEFKP